MSPWGIEQFFSHLNFARESSQECDRVAPGNFGQTIVAILNNTDFKRCLSVASVATWKSVAVDNRKESIYGNLEIGKAYENRWKKSQSSNTWDPKIAVAEIFESRSY